MGISPNIFDQHIIDQTSTLTNYRRNWLNYLFRHEPVENAMQILTSGMLYSRNDAKDGGVVNNDIAPEHIIQNRDAAYDRARLYFRPRTPTQYHIEGIRKESDYYSGKHGGFLVMFMFDARTILTTPDTNFSCGNMQSPYSHILDGDAAFKTLNFVNIYHDSAQNDPEVVRQRCAEVLPVSPLKLDTLLKHIIVRSDADVQTLKYMLNTAGLGKFAQLVQKSKGTGTFFNNYTCVDYVDLSGPNLLFKLRHSKSLGKIVTEITLKNTTDGKTSAHMKNDLKALTKYKWCPKVIPGNYELEIKLENSFAYHSNITLTN